MSILVICLYLQRLRYFVALDTIKNLSFMKEISSDELLTLLDCLCDSYKKTSVVFVSGSSSEIVDDQGADLLRLIHRVTCELVSRIELPF